MEQTLQTERDRPVVVSIDLHQVRMPFSQLAQTAMAESDNGLGMAIPAEEPWEYGDFLFARLLDENGTEGWGEVFVWLPESGVSSTEMTAAIAGHLGRYVLGRSPADVRAIRAKMDRNVARNEMAKGLLDLACHDLAARQIGRPVYDLLGGSGTDRVPMAGLVPLAPIESVVVVCQAYVDAGYRTLRIKLGTDPDVDRDTIAAVRDAVGPHVRIRVDYNQAYRAAEAIRAIRMLEPFGLDAAEQPLPIGDVLGMVEVQKHTPVPLFLHEGFFNMADLVSVVALGGSRVVGVNLERPGGLVGALDAIDWAKAQGMGTIIHNQSLGLSSAAHIHLAAARHDVLGHDVELAGDVMFEHPLVRDPLRVHDGHTPVPTGPGWGVEVDLDALDNYSCAVPVSLAVSGEAVSGEGA